MKRWWKTWTKNEQKIHRKNSFNTKHGTLPKTTVLTRNLQNNDILDIGIWRILKALQTLKIIQQIFHDSIRQKMLCMFPVTWLCLLKSTDPKILFTRMYKIFKRLIICLLKTQRFASLCHLMWVRYFTFFVSDLSVLKFD